MDFLTDLWLPIISCGAALFFAGFAASRLPPHHFSDWIRLPAEDRFMSAIREMNIPPGNYMFHPCESKRRQSSPESAEQYTACPPSPEGQFPKVFLVAGATGMIVHASSLKGIWLNRRMATDSVDGIANGMIIGLIFALLWPVSEMAGG